MRPATGVGVGVATGVAVGAGVAVGVDAGVAVGTGDGVGEGAGAATANVAAESVHLYSVTQSDEKTPRPTRYVPVVASDGTSHVTVYVRC